MQAFSRTIILAVTFLIASSALLAATPAISAEQKPPAQVLITNVNVFDGFSDQLQKGMSVLVEGNHIKEVGKDLNAGAEAKVIDGGGRTMTPGLIDMHGHVTFNTPEGTNTFTYEWDFGASGALAAQALRDDMLMKGITTVRDIAGNSRGIANAIKKNLLIGPRLYTSGGVLSHTGGHGDWGAKNDADPSDYGVLIQQSYIVDGREDVIRASRRNYRGGAHFTKIMAGGGVSSVFDPLEIMGATQEEVEAAVEIATDYGTYVAIHAYHDKSYNRSLDAGVRSFEHGFLVTEPTVQRMAKMIAEGKKIAWSFQCFMSVKTFGDYDAMPDFFTHEQKLKGVAVGKGARNAAKLMKKHGVFTIGGADMFGIPFKDMIKEDITCNVDAGYTPAEALKHWTGNAGIVLKWSGPLDPYPTYEIGTIKAGAYADMLLWKGNPLEDINLILDEDKLQLIMKDGKIYKNTIPAAREASRDEDAATIRARLTIDGRIAIYGVQFQSDSAELIEGSERTIEIIASVLKDNPKVKIAVVGHTDDEGGHDYNLDLSKDRADAVVAALIGDYGIAEKRLFAAGASFLSPIASNESEAGRALNRRVELVRVH